MQECIGKHHLRKTFFKRPRSVLVCAAVFFCMFVNVFSGYREIRPNIPLVYENISSVFGIMSTVTLVSQLNDFASEVFADNLKHAPVSPLRKNTGKNNDFRADKGVLVSISFYKFQQNFYDNHFFSGRNSSLYSEFTKNISYAAFSDKMFGGAVPLFLLFWLSLLYTGNSALRIIAMNKNIRKTRTA